MDTSIWIYTLGAVTIVSLIPLVGVLTLGLTKEKLLIIVLPLVGFSVGALLGDSFFHLLPEAYRNDPQGIETSVSVIGGLLLFFILEKFLRWRHCHLPTTSHHPHPLATINLVGDGIHNLIDGLLIGGAFSVNPQLGVTTTLAVIFHEIPQEIGDLGVLLHAGLTLRKALILNLLSALPAVLGATLSLLLGSLIEGYAPALLPITAGGFIYIAGSDLIPELHHDCDLKTSAVQLLSLLLGLGVMFVLILAE